MSLMQDMADDLDLEPGLHLMTDEECAKADALRDIEAEAPGDAANIFAVERAYEVTFE